MYPGPLWEITFLRDKPPRTSVLHPWAPNQKSYHQRHKTHMTRPHGTGSGAAIPGCQNTWHLTGKLFSHGNQHTLEALTLWFFFPFLPGHPWFLKARTGWEKGQRDCTRNIGVLGSLLSPTLQSLIGLLELCLQAGQTQSGNNKGWGAPCHPLVPQRGLCLPCCHPLSPLERWGWARAPFPMPHTSAYWYLQMQCLSVASLLTVTLNCDKQGLKILAPICWSSHSLSEVVRRLIYFTWRKLKHREFYSRVRCSRRSVFGYSNHFPSHLQRALILNLFSLKSPLHLMALLPKGQHTKSD